MGLSVLGWSAPGTYMPERVQVVVGELEFLEGDQLPHPMRPGGWRVRVHVQAARHGGLRFASHRPKPRNQLQRTWYRRCTRQARAAGAAERENDLEMA